MIRRVVTIGVSAILILLAIVIVDFPVKLLDTVHADTLYVGGTESGNYSYIQWAIDNASHGDTVFVYDDSAPYYENVYVDKSINFIGEDRDLTIIDGGGSGNVVTINADWVNMSGFTVRNSGGDFDNVGIQLESNNSNITGNTIPDSTNGIYSIATNGNIIANNSITSDLRGGIIIESSNDTIITGNVMMDCGISLAGDLLTHWNTHTIDMTNTINGAPVVYWKDRIGGTVPPGVGQVILANCRNVIAENQVVNQVYTGIELGFSSNNLIANNTVSNNAVGVFIYLSHENIITNNTVSSSQFVNFVIRYSDDNHVTENQIKSCQWLEGIQMSYSNGNTFRDNTISSNGGSGFWFRTSQTNNIINNTISSNSDYGLYLSDSSSSNVISGNTISSNNYHGLYIEDSDTNNVMGNDASYNDLDGILLENSHDNDIIDNVMTNNGFFGMSILGSDNNLLADSVLSSNTHYGLEIESAWQNDIVNNSFNDNDRGIYLHLTSKFNIIRYNNISNNIEYGIYIYASSPTDNVIYNNNFYDNTNQARDDTAGGNQWDNGYPTGGNYWNDYTGVDEKSGVDQNQQGSDGIGDTSYDIDSDSIDNYPLMVQHGTSSGPVQNLDKDIFYYKIQDAIDDADSGNTIFVSHGTYYENVIVNKTLNLIGEERNTTIIDGGGSGDVVWINANYVNFTGFTIKNSGGTFFNYGILLNSNYSKIEENIVSDNMYGIHLESSSRNIITNNIVTSNIHHGIYLHYSSTHNNITDNVIYQGGFSGIYIIGSGWNIITGNLISSNINGIFVYSSFENTIKTNDIISNRGHGIYLCDDISTKVDSNNISYNHPLYYDVGFGISLTRSKGSIITNNVLNEDGFYIDGDILEYWNTHIIAVNNTINGKPIYYWRNQTVGTIQAGAGQVILANCTNVKVENQELTYCGIGILMGYSNNNNVLNNNVSNNLYGTHLVYSNNNNITNNTALSNELYGFYFKSSNNNLIVNCNTSTNDWYGIYINSSMDNTIERNNITNNNEYGIYIESSSNNYFYHNNILDNTNQAYDDGNTNQWDNGYPDGGNYWSDYSGVDDYSGPNQDQTGSDGIGDTYYEIDPNSRDNYPLIIPYGTSPPPNSPPNIIDVAPSDSWVLIESIIYIYINATDFEDSEDLLTPIVEWQINNTEPSGEWSNEFINYSEVNYIGGPAPDGWLSVPFEPSLGAQVGYYDFRAKVKDSENNESEEPEWIYIYRGVCVYRPDPIIHDIIIQSESVYRGESVFITLNATDDFDEESELTLQIQYRFIYESLWTNIPGSSINYDYNKGYWIIEFITNYTSQLGDCEFRGRVNNSGGRYSNGGEWTVSIPGYVEILNNKPFASNFRTEMGYSVERGSSIDIYVDGEDLEDGPVDLTPYFEYRSENNEWENTYLFDLISPAEGGKTWRITFSPPPDYGFLIGRYHFRISFRDKDGDIGDVLEVPYFIEVLNVVPMVDNLSIPKSGYRMETFYITANCSDIDYSEGMLTPIFQYKSPNGHWVSYGDSESWFKNVAFYENECWQIAFKPSTNAELGNYDFRVQFQDEITNCQWFTVNDEFLLKNNKPSVKIKEPESGQQSTTTIEFEAEASDIEDTILSYEWNFGDNSETSTEESPTHTFSQGTWIVSLTVIDSDGDTASDTISVTIPLDTDEDGIIDDLDYDDDDDGLTDFEEIDIGTDPINYDTDDDGHNDFDDFYPLDATKWKEPEDSSEFNYWIVLIVMVIIIISISSVLLINNKKKSSKPHAPTQTPYVQPAIPQSPQINQPIVQITCPQCMYSFNITNTGGPTQIQCPNCGVTGTVNLGGTVHPSPPAANVSPPLHTPPQEIRCPGCQNIFRVETTTRPISLRCPHCGISGTLN